MACRCNQKGGHKMKKAYFFSLFVVEILVGGHPSAAQKPDFKVLAFHSNRVERDHVDFSKQVRAFFTQLSDEKNFTFDVTTDWTNLNDTLLRNYQVVMWVNDFPHTEQQKKPFSDTWKMAVGGWVFM